MGDQEPDKVRKLSGSLAFCIFIDFIVDSVDRKRRPRDSASQLLVIARIHLPRRMHVAESRPYRCVSSKMTMPSRCPPSARCPCPRLAGAFSLLSGWPWIGTWTPAIGKMASQSLAVFTIFLLCGDTNLTPPTVFAMVFFHFYIIFTNASGKRGCLTLSLLSSATHTLLYTQFDRLPPKSRRSLFVCPHCKYTRARRTMRPSFVSSDAQ
jgi:hypothetical protein